MKKVLLGAILFGLTLVVPVTSMAGVSINIGIPLPPPIIFPAPPAVIVLPDTDDVYVDPYISADIYFWGGWWWRYWDGRWYRSPYYDRDWIYYNMVPSFYFEVDPDWRVFYGRHMWRGHPWNFQRIPYGRLHNNWRAWHRDRHWRRESWGVRNFHPMPMRQRQEMIRNRRQQYQRRPEVQRHMRERPGPRMPAARRPMGRPEGRPQVGPRGPQRGGRPQGRPEGVRGGKPGKPQGRPEGRGGGRGDGRGERENR